jgi:6-pyruvoyltetrahydropterin/6-carboxytetrahydropterin synthase
LTEEENVELYGKCNNLNGHGHNYTLIVTLKGQIDRKTGMLINLTTLKEAIHNVLEDLDHKNIVRTFSGDCVIDVLGQGC